MKIEGKGKDKGSCRDNEKRDEDEEKEEEKDGEDEDEVPKRLGMLTDCHEGPSMQIFSVPLDASGSWWDRSRAC